MDNNLNQNKTEDRKFLFLLSSARSEGNTETLTRLAADSLPASIAQDWINLNDITLSKFQDKRHSGGDFPIPQGMELMLALSTISATDIVISSPLYWYTLSANAKTYLDYWSGWLRVQELDFKNKMKGKNLWAVTATSDEGDLKVQPLIGTLKLIADYMKMNWGGILIGHGDRPKDILKDIEAIKTTQTFFNN